VVRKYLRNHGERQRRIGGVVASFARDLGRGLGELEGRAEEIRSLTPDQFAVMTRAATLLGSILPRVNIIDQAEQQQALLDLVRSIGSAADEEE
jgi:hypothetical protein